MRIMKKAIWGVLLVVICMFAACSVSVENTAVSLHGNATDPTNTAPAILPPTVSTSPSTIPSQPSEPYLTHNPYIISDAHREHLGDDYALYCSFVDAMLDYNSTVSGFSSQQQLTTIWQIFQQEFYPAKAICATYHDTPTPFFFEDGVATVSFLLDEQTHHQVLSQYENTINYALSIIEQDDSEVEIIEKIYKFVSTNMSYDINKTRSNMYESIISGVGVCRHYAEYMILLLRHAEIEAFSCSSSYAPIGIYNHMWVIAKMDGQYYHFDPTWQNTASPWEWFALSDDARYSSLLPQGLTINAVKGHWPTEEKSDTIYVYLELDPYRNCYPEIPACTDSYYDVRRFTQNSNPSLW